VPRGQIATAREANADKKAKERESNRNQEGTVSLTGSKSLLLLVAPGNKQVCKFHGYCVVFICYVLYPKT
jgi:hypothetical protein